MADFSVLFTGDTTLELWTDPPALDGSQPSRTNPNALHPHRRRVVNVGSLVEVTVRCTNPAGEVVDGELDYNLGGRTFMAWLAEFPGTSRPNVTHPPDQSTVQRFTPTRPGHYTLVLRRTQGGGGGVFVHVDAIDRG